MATLTSITSNVDTNLADASNIQASEHRSVLHGSSNSVIENFYGLKTGDTNGSINVVTEVATNKGYIINTIKQGGKVWMSGTITNSTGSITPSNEVWFNITTTEYKQQASSPIYIRGFSGGTNTPIRMVLTTNAFATLEPIGIGETVEFTITYNTQN